MNAPEVSDAFPAQPEPVHQHPLGSGARRTRLSIVDPILPRPMTGKLLLFTGPRTGIRRPLARRLQDPAQPKHPRLPAWSARQVGRPHARQSSCPRVFGGFVPQQESCPSIQDRDEDNVVVARKQPRVNALSTDQAGISEWKLALTVDLILFGGWFALVGAGV